MDFFFNFPYDYPFASFLMAFSLAYVLSFKDDKLAEKSGLKLKLCLSLLGLASLYLCVAKFKSNSVFEQKTVVQYEQVCQLLPSSWRVCAQSALLDFDDKKYDKAIEKSLNMLRKYPQNLVASQILIQSKIHQRRYRSACQNIQESKIPALKHKYKDYYQNLCMKFYSHK